MNGEKEKLPMERNVALFASNHSRRNFMKLCGMAALGGASSMLVSRLSNAENPPETARQKGSGGSATFPFFAAVVQMPLYGINDREPERQTMERNAGRVVETMEHIIALSDVAPKLIVLPVLCLNGIGTAIRLSKRPIRYNIQELAVDLNSDKVLTPVKDACARHGCYVVSSCIEKHPAMPGRYFHTGFVLGQKGLVLRSPKTQAPTSSGITLLRDAYKEYIGTFGSEAVLPVVETPIGKIGCLVEGEFLVSEATRTLTRKGAEIIVHPTATHYGPANPPYAAIQQTLAYTNGV